MKIELLGAIDYTKLENELKRRNVGNYDEIIEYIRDLEKFSRVEKVTAAGRLSRFAGDIFDVLKITDKNTFEQNVKYVKMIIGMGHDSITDHDYSVFAIKNVSPVIEQTIIAERFSSFTVKSRREVDFSNAGFYIPDFHNRDGILIPNNKEIKLEYQDYMKSLFIKYKLLEKMELPKEDARFILPYSYYSNIIMGVDAHTLKNMIIKFTKTHLSKIQELREFGERLYEIAKENIPYIIDEIDKAPYQDKDVVREYIDNNVQAREYSVLNKVELLNSSNNIDDTIFLSSLMRRYQFDYNQAKNILEKISAENPNFKRELMHKIVFEGDKNELAQVNFQFQIPISFAILTHLTRHRTHQILIPEFSPNIDLSQYKVPPKANIICPGEIESVFNQNLCVYNHFKNDYGIREEDLIYFTLSGNMVNIVTNMDGKTVEHILGLRTCNKAQWEIREISSGMHSEINKLENSRYFSSILGAPCVTQGICNEGKECCGKIYTLKK